MKNPILIALAIGLVMPLATDVAAKPAKNDNNPNQINVSCYRGAFYNTVAWDRPNAVFVEDLIQLGYDYNEATAIGERICRDEHGVGNGQYRINELRRILRESPPRR